MRMKLIVFVCLCSALYTDRIEDVTVVVAGHFVDLDIDGAVMEEGAEAMAGNAAPSTLPRY